MSAATPPGPPPGSSPKFPPKPPPAASPPGGARGLLRSGLLVSAMTLLSRLLGFVRDQVFAISFGAGPLTDAFFVAFKIPNFLRRLFGEGAFAQAFVPVFTEYRERRSAAALRDLAAHVCGTLGGVLLVVTTFGVAAAPLLVLIFAPGFADDAERYAAAADMLRITFPYIFFISLVAYAGGMLNSGGRFAVPAFTPVLLNVCLIAAALFAAPHFERPIIALAWGVLAAGVVQLAFQLPFLARMGLLPRPRWGWRHSGVRRILKLMAPAILGSSVAQINLLLDTLIASFLTAGSVSWLYYSDRLVEFPLGVFGIALATVILPRLSADHANRDPARFRRALDWALRMAALIAIPAAAGLALLAAPILASLFQYGAFTALDTQMAAASLVAYALGLPGFVFIKILAPGFFARQDTKTPVRIGIVALLSNMILNVLLVVPLVLADYAAPHVGLAAATALSAWLQALMLYRCLRRERSYRPEPGWGRHAARIAVALLAMAALLLWLTPPGAVWSALPALQRGGVLLGIIFTAAACYAACLWLLGLRPRHLRA